MAGDIAFDGIGNLTERNCLHCRYYNAADNTCRIYPPMVVDKQGDQSFPVMVAPATSWCAAGRTST